MPHYPQHLPAFDYRGFYRYFLTFCTFERNSYFVNSENVGLVLNQILRAGAQYQFAVIAYCFMPDHVHLFVEGTREDADLKTFIARAKQYSGFYFRRQTRNSLWQRYGFERMVREDDDTPSAIRYVIGNPVRAGLVQTPMDYPFWGSGVYSREALLEYAARAG
jgi:REP-associated tyrosine transposase